MFEPESEEESDTEEETLLESSLTHLLFYRQVILEWGAKIIC